MSYLYILSHPHYFISLNKQYVKIGSTTNPMNRLHVYNTSSYHSYKYVILYQFSNEDTSSIIENEIKTLYSEYNYRDPINPGGTEIFKNDIIILIEEYITNNYDNYKILYDIDNIIINDSNISDTIIEDYNIKRKIQYKNQFQDLRSAIAPYSYQQETISIAANFFQVYDRGMLLLFCRLGKTLISYWIVEKLNYNKILYLVPSTDLIIQTYHQLKKVTNLSILLICSGRIKDVMSTTNIDHIKKFISDNSQYIIICTYQSSKLLINIKMTIDMAIYDESHKTTGILMHNSEITNFKITLKDSNLLKINKRLFMTATDKVYTQINDECTIYSMDDKELYGEIIHTINCKKALELNAINDYSIVTINGYIEGENEYYCKANAILKVIMEKNIKHMITYHITIKNADEFKKILDEIIEKNNYKIKVYTINGNISLKERIKILSNFQSDENITIITSAKILQEGINLPNCDCVSFIDVKTSLVDCIQSISRCFTKMYGKGKSYIIIPIISPNNNIVNDKNFTALKMVLRNLNEVDNRIITYFTDNNHKVSSGNNLFEYIDNTNIINQINPNNFLKYISSKVWTNLNLFTYRPFELAKEYIIKLKLKSIDEWKELVNNELLPNDIPKNPHKYYKSFGWIDYHDWLGLNDINMDTIEIVENNDTNNINKYDDMNIEKSEIKNEHYFKHSIVLVSISGKSFNNFQKTVLNPNNNLISKDLFKEFLNNDTFNNLGDHVRVWGIKNNTIDNQLQHGSLILFVNRYEIYIAEIIHKIHSKEISKKLYNDINYENLYIIKLCRKNNINKRDFLTSLGYNKRDTLMATRIVSNDHLNEYLYKFIYG